MKRKLFGNNGGFTLIEVVVAITVLALIVAPIGGALVVSVRVNSYSDRLLQARLDVAAVADQLMAEGVVVEEKTGTSGSKEYKIKNLPSDAKVTVTCEPDGGIFSYYIVKITSTVLDSVSIETCIHQKGGTGS